MYEELLKRIRQVAEEVCEDYDVDPYNAEQRFFVIEEAAKAIEEMQKKYDGAVSDNKSLCRQIAELAKERNEAYSKGVLEGGIAQRAEDEKWMPKWIPIWATRRMTMPVIIPATAETVTQPKPS